MRTLSWVSCLALPFLTLHMHWHTLLHSPPIGYEHTASHARVQGQRHTRRANIWVDHQQDRQRFLLVIIACGVSSDASKHCRIPHKCW